MSLSVYEFMRAALRHTRPFLQSVFWLGHTVSADNIRPCRAASALPCVARFRTDRSEACILRADERIRIEQQQQQQRYRDAPFNEHV